MTFGSRRTSREHPPARHDRSQSRRRSQAGYSDRQGSGEAAASSDETLVRCAHCGQSCDRAHLLTSDEKPFCCTGCRSVYEILRDHELCDYYTIRAASDAADDRSSVAAGDRFASHRDYAALDEPAIVRSLVSYLSETRQRIVWNVPSLHCASCVWLLEQLDRFDAGVLMSEVDILRKTVTVDLDPRVTSARRVAEGMAGIGYAPVIQLENPDSNAPKKARSTTRALYSRIGIAGFAAGNTMMIYVARYFAQSERAASGMGSLLGSRLEWVFGWMSVALSIPVLLYSASPWFTAAWAALRGRRITLDVPVALGILVLFIRSVTDLAMGTGEGYLDSFNGLVFFLLIGRLFQQKAFDALSFDRTYRSFFPLSVRVERSSGEQQIIPIEQIAIGEKLSVRNAEVVPCEAVLQSEAAYVDYSFVTGEAMPVECTAGAIIHAGGRIIGRSANLVAMKPVSHSELGAMWGRSTASAKRRPRLLDLSDLFGKWFTALALIIAVVGAAFWLPDLRAAFDVFTAVLIIACPCALTLATPITLGTAMGVLGRFGIYLKNVSVLLELPRITAVFFDKTGTLTFSNPDITFRGRDLTDDEWRMIRSVAAQSVHPLSRAIAAELQEPVSPVSYVHEEVGRGLEARVEDREVRIGALDFVARPPRASFAELPWLAADDDTAGSVYISIDDELVGGLHITSRVRPRTALMLRDLRESVALRLISGDTDREVPMLEPFFEREEMQFSCTPDKKNAEIAAARAKGQHVLMVGDGLNDAGAMETADVAVAVSEDTATLVPACDAIMFADSLIKLPLLLRYARQLKRVILASFVFSIVYNLIGLWLAVAGLLTPLAAAILMPVSSITVIGVSVAGARFFGRRRLWA